LALAPSTEPKKDVVWKKALLQSLVAAAVGTLMFYLGHSVIAVIIWTIAGVLIVSGTLIKPVYRKIEAFGQRLGRIVAILLTWLLLCPFYYLFFFPMALLHKGKSQKIFSSPNPETSNSYWIARSVESDIENYTRQY
jgi:hypothetical protein